MSAGFRVVIPARYASTRFPGKALAELDGRPMIHHVIERARESAAREVIVATDDERIAAAAREGGADVAITHAEHAAGTDRVAEVAQAGSWSDDTIVVNLQGDAPLLPGPSVDQVAGLLMQHDSASVATLAVPIRDEREFRDPHTVKVVFDRAGRAMYFSRASIPAGDFEFDLDSPLAWRHIGLYAYRVDALRRLTAARPCGLERSERLEQLRALWLGMEIRVGIAAEEHGPDVDTPEDLVAAQRYLSRRGR